MSVHNRHQLPKSRKDAKGIMITDLEQQEVPHHTQVVVYLCPTKGCGNYYGNTTFRKDRTPDIDVVMERRGSESGERHKTYARTECPDCRTRGSRVKRIPYLVTAVIPLDAVVKSHTKALAREAHKRRREEAA